MSVDPRTDQPPLNTGGAGAADTTILPYRLRHTLGYLNGAALGNVTRLPTMQGYEGAPTVPFPWIAWNNRPFANHLELLTVPSSSPGRLLFEFKMGDPIRGRYRSTDPTDGPYLYPFGHLLNFFRSSVDPSTSPVPQFYRLLDYVEVPSRFVGTETWYDDATVTSSLTFQPPFNLLSTFRDPGKVNLNTISDVRVLNALMHGFPEGQTAVDDFGSDTFWYRFQRSRRGYETEGVHGSVATQFANPFRSAAAADLVPDGAKPQDNWLGPVDATLLRRDPVSAGSGDDPYKPLFAMGMPSISGPVTYHYDPRRNAFFRYQGIQRLGNMVTTHSNVFAVWVTVGLFEWDPNQPDNELGREVGLETGNVERHRAFYMIDRSIPVAFEPGENHNVDRAVILRRFIE